MTKNIIYTKRMELTVAKQKYTSVVNVFTKVTGLDCMQLSAPGYQKLSFQQASIIPQQTLHMPERQLIQ